VNQAGGTAVFTGMNRYSFAAGAAALSLLLAACGSSTTTPTPAAPATSGSSATSGDTATTAGGIVIKDFKYSGTLSVKAGDKVTVTNQDTAAHTATGKTAGQFDTGKVDAGKSGTFTAPATAGSYPVICTYHSKMAATLIVTG
jgi:plastocyanin